MFMKNICLTLIVLSSASAMGQASETIRPQNIKIASPNAASLGKVADIPIGYHTGTPNIDIPIYTLHEGPLQMPISVSYHASGLKVMEQASWVGAGWSLSAGGMITRSVRGMPDEVLSSSGSPTPISYLNNKGYSDYLWVDAPSGEYSPQIVPSNPATNAPQVLAYNEFSAGRRDGEADMFNFNFNGYSGKFYFRPDNSVALAPQQDIKITPLFCPGGTACSTTNEYLYGWIVTTPDGVRYYFGKVLAQAANYNTTTNAIPLEYTTSYSYTSGLSYNKTASSWFLNKVESADKKFSISLVYSVENYSYYTTSLSPTASFTSASQTIDLVKNIMSGVRLSSIQSSNNSLVTFVPSAFTRRDLSSASTNLMDFDADSTDVTAPHALGEVRISNSPTTSFCQSFAFSYGYFYDNSHALTGYLANPGTSFNVHSDKKRLALRSITERTCDGSVLKPPHSFTYFDETSVPRTLSFAQDHWGYYNGNTSNASMLPAISIDNGLTNLSGTYGNRDSKWPEMRAGALQKITYPTGGSSRFAFESHDVFIPVNLYDSISHGKINANYTNTTPGGSFTVTQSTTMKARVNLNFYGLPNGSGNIHLVNTSTLVDYGFTGSNGLRIFQLPAGTYQYSVQSSSGSTGAIECSLYEIVYLYQTQQDVVVGGLRIDSLIYETGTNGPPRIQTFDYVDDNGAHQGVLFSRPAYVALMRNYTTIDHGGIPMGTNYLGTPYQSQNGCLGGDGEPTTPTNFLFYVSGNAILPMTTSQGNHFGYNYVRVNEIDGSKTIYKFSLSQNPASDVCVRVINHTDCNNNLPNYPPAPDPFKPERGELVSKYVYNSSGVLLYKEFYTNDYQEESVGVRGLLVKPYSTFFFPTEYEWKSKKKVKTTTETFTYDAANPGATPFYKKNETYFASTRHTQPTQNVLSDANNYVLHDMRSTYTADLVVQGCPDLEATLSSADASLTTALSTAHSANDYAGCGTASCKLSKWLLYTYNANIAWKTNATSRATAIANYKSCMTGTTGSWSWSSASPELKALVKLKTRNQVTSVVERTQWRNTKLLSAEYVTYMDFAGDTLSIYPGKLDMVRTAAPLTSSNFTGVALTSTGVTRDSKYALEETYGFSNGNIVQTTPISGVTSSYIWNAFQQYPVAEIKNAASGTSAFTSFEEAANEGGWQFTYTNTTAEFKTGVKSHSLSGNDVSRSGLNSATTYIISYWAKGGTPTLTNGVVSSNDAGSAEADGWKYFEKTFTNATAVVISGGSGIYLDELRMYPKGAMMTSYTYKPLTGIISSTDPNNRSQYFDYDGLGRLTLIKDAYRNILKQYKYNYRTTVTGIQQ
jgi:YD repeat-containing protein